MTIHSFSRTLRVRRSLNAIDLGGGRRVILPNPVPMVAIGYFAALEAGFWVLSRLPVVGVFSRLPWHLYWVFPLWLVYLAMTTRFDGRLPHRWLVSWVAFHARPRRTFAGRKVTDDRRMRVRARAFFDEHSPRLHKARIHGPARVTFTDPVWFGLSAWHRNFVAHPGGNKAEHDVRDWIEVRP